MQLLKNMFADHVDVLGTKYSIEVKGYNDDPAFSKSGIDGYCEQGTHRIVIGDLHTWPGWEDESEEFIIANMKHTLKHELCHGIFSESGMEDNGDKCDGPWCRHEPLIDWIAIQGPKLYKIWQQANAL